jgi:threonine dehydrogenase-like Zn-dependent dehydrogenase
MKTSESIKEIAGALVKAQTEIKAAIKDATNPFFKNKYADLASVIEAVRIPLNKAGISFLQPASADEHGVIVETVLLHSSGEWISESLHMPVNKQDAQAVGSAITYGRRYGLQSLCGVPSEDDDGERATKTVSMPKTTITPTTGAWEAMNEKQQSRLTDLATIMKEAITMMDVPEACRIMSDAGLETEEKVALWTRFDSKQRSAMKAAAAKAEQAA